MCICRRGVAVAATYILRAADLLDVRSHRSSRHKSPLIRQCEIHAYKGNAPSIRESRVIYLFCLRFRDVALSLSLCCVETDERGILFCTYIINIYCRFTIEHHL